MPFLSLEFAALLGIAVVTFHAIPSRTRKYFLLALSYAYYATWGLKPLGLLIVATFLVWLVAPRVAPAAADIEPTAGARRWLWSSLSVLFGLLFSLKYLPTMAHGPLAPILVPLGVSYYTFRLTSYLIDVYWGKVTPTRDFALFALYTAFFPQIVSGPIQRAEDFFAQVQSRGAPDPDRVARGLRLILFGLFKKLLVANRIALIVNTVFDEPHKATGAAFLVGAYAFAIQLYADFSGITDIALGIGCLFGVEGPPNFNNPFYAPNIQVFWKRWHMSLTSWIGDYLFTPLQMALRNWGSAGLIVAILVNMVAIGAWHGANWNCIVFGLINGIYMVVSALTLKRRNKIFRARPLATKVRAVLGPVVTFHLVVLALTVFHAHSLEDARYILAHLIPTHASVVGLQGLGLRIFGVPGVVALVVMEVIHVARGTGALERALAFSPRWARWSAYYALVAFVLWFGLVDIQVFIYAGY